jgi:hypothetical protein
MALVMGWVARSRVKPRPHSESQRLVHPFSTLIIGVVGFVFFAGLAIVSNVFANKTVTWWTTTIFVGFALLSLPMVADYFLARHDVSEEGLSYGRLTGRRGYLKWSDLSRVNYAPGMKWFRLETESGEVARISAMLRGLPEFARLLLARTPAHAIDADALSVLQATPRVTRPRSGDDLITPPPSARWRGAGSTAVSPAASPYTSSRTRPAHCRAW